MNRVFLKTPSALIAGVALLSITACTDSNEPAAAGGGSDETIPLALKGMPPMQTPGYASDALSEVNVFHFKGEDFLQRTDIDDPYAESISLPTNGTTRIYCAGGLQVSASQGTKEADFLTTTVSCEPNSEHSPLFYSGSADFPDAGMPGGLEIEMKRSVARIDFVNTVDPEIKISKLIVEDAPSATFVFEQEGTAECSATSFTREFAEPFTGKEEGMFTIFESAAPVHVRILGDYKDTPINIRTTLATTERNKVYTLQITNIDSHVGATFTYKDWEEGHTTGAVASTSRGIFIDKINSIVPEGVEVEYGKNTVTVPYAGAKDMKLAFLADTKISLASVEGEIATTRISANEAVKLEEGYLSSFNVTVDPNNRLSYTVILNLKDERGRTNFVEIKVLDNKTRKIETVEIAGATWMAFNCTGPDLSKQVYPVDGLSVEETYINNWLGAIGNLYQFGRQYGYVPYMGYSPSNDLGGQKQDMPWVNYSHMPCPEGYHIATLQEFRDLCPQGTKIPGTYTAGNGESITVSVHQIESELITPTKIGGVGRYMKFKSNDTGNELILPIAGYKSDKSTAANALLGKDAVYWTNSNQSCYGGHARAFRFMFNWGEEAAMDEFQWPMEAFAYARAIKNVESNEE